MSLLLVRVSITSSLYFLISRFVRWPRARILRLRSVITNTIDTEDNANTVYTSVTQAFANDNYYEKGLLFSGVMTDGEGNKYVEKINDCELKDISSGAALTDAQLESDAGNAFPALLETTQLFYEGQSDPANKHTRSMNTALMEI